MATADTEVRLKFGRHKGRTVEAIPTAYLRWLMNSDIDLDDDLTKAVLEELACRRAERAERAAALDDDEEEEEFRPAPGLDEKLRQWHRDMVMRFHPDRGGSHEGMVAINVGYERLKELLEVAECPASGRSTRRREA
ncbi:hypothetical protein AYO40_05055 [Planctomycetaceae bacterium SCGC AG-212-D15]|nr:hypothetical protein AYO40_05055 [Planctomycetaceae bacterium SCGC AG-212-D15]